MTTVREALRRLINRERLEAPSEFSYTIYWTKVVRAWDETQRRRAMESVERIMRDPGFVPNEYRRRYGAREIDGSAHSGASLMALHKVLKAFRDQAG